MAYFFQPSLSGLLLQAVGAFLMAALCIALLRTVRRPALRYWSVGWLALCVSLQGLYLASYYDTFRQSGQVVYLCGEYIFGYLVIAGCRRYATGASPNRREAWLLVPLVAFAVTLARFAGGNVDVFFAVHTLIYSFLFFRALRVLRVVKPGRHALLGLGVMKMALLLLTIDYLHYAPLFATSSYQHLRVFDAYLAYAPLYDLIFQVMLMFGMVMAVTGEVQQDLESTNADLKEARDQLEATSRMDPLTSALNRRAFSAVLADRSLAGRAITRGVMAVVDLDGLKLLNDRFGHAAGDAALQALVGALRACVQSEDLLFRWGGDEFVLLLKDRTAASAEACCGGLNERLRGTRLPGAASPIDLRASVGFSEFEDSASLNSAIARADEAMYQRKEPPKIR